MLLNTFSLHNQILVHFKTRIPTLIFETSTVPFTLFFRLKSVGISTTTTVYKCLACTCVTVKVPSSVFFCTWSSVHRCNADIRDKWWCMCCENKCAWFQGCSNTACDYFTMFFTFFTLPWQPP